jgi:hypothetical protein
MKIQLRLRVEQHTIRGLDSLIYVPRMYSSRSQNLRLRTRIISLSIPFGNLVTWRPLDPTQAHFSDTRFSRFIFLLLDTVMTQLLYDKC